MNESQISAVPLRGSPELERQVDRFEEAWQSGPPPRIEAYLPPATDHNPTADLRRRDLLEEFIAIDLEYRWRRAVADGLPACPRLEDYLARYPELGPHERLPVALIGEEYRVRHQWGDRPRHVEYAERFPGHGAALTEALTRLDAELAADSVPGPRCVSCPSCGKTFAPKDRATLAGKASLAPGPAIDALAGPAFADYEILGELGRGGMGIVYKARDRRLDRLVALKMMRDGTGADPDDRARFRREAEAVARLQHPNIVQIYEVGEQAGLPYCALEFVAGRSLAQELDGMPQPPRHAAELVEVLARAMNYAHARGIVHRDLKPANILLRRKSEIRNPKSETDSKPEFPMSETTPSSNFGLVSDFGFRISDLEPKVTDFGLAKHLDREAGQTQSGSILGTPSYMAPEQVEGERGAIGPPADVYALGAVLYEMLTGRPPFKGESVFDTLDQVRSQEPVPPRRLQPKVPRDLETICLKCLGKRSAQRYPSAEALADDLRCFQAGEPIRARPAGVWERGVKWARRRPAAAVAVAVSGLAALLLIVGGVWSNAALRAAAEREHHEAQQARLQQQHAAANFRLARDAVEQCYNQLSQDAALRQPGLEATRRQLLHTALSYYEKFVADHGDDPDVQFDLAQAYHRLGDITGQLGAAAEGIPFYRRALDVWARLRERPEEPAQEGELAALQTHLGNALVNAGQPDDARAAFAQAQAIIERRARARPGVVPHQRELADGYVRLGHWYSQHGQADQAETTYRQALGFWEGLGHADPGTPQYRGELAKTLNSLGAGYRQTRQHGKAEQAYARARTIQEELVDAQPDAADFRSDLAATHNNLGLLYKDNFFTRPRAEAALQKALELYERLIHDCPDVRRYQKEQALVFVNLGAVYAAFGSSGRTRAETAYRRAVDQLEKLARVDPDDLEIPYRLGMTYGYLGLLAKAGNVHSAALDWQTRAVDRLAAVWRKEPRPLEIRTALRNAHMERAKELLHLSRGADSLPDWEWAIELDDQGEFRETLLFQRAIAWARVGNHVRATAEANALADKPSMKPGDHYDLACIYALSLAALDTDAKLTKAEREELAAQYGARALALLTRAQGAHYFASPAERNHLKTDTDLASLRPRADFQKLLAAVEVEAKAPAR